MNAWERNASKNILANSTSQDFKTALVEWEFSGVVNDYKLRCISCEMCEHEKLRYHFAIKNPTTGKELKVGSSCILKFADIRVIDRHGRIATGNLRGIVLDNALTELQKQMMLIPLRTLWTRNVKFRDYITKQVGYYKKNGAFYPMAIVRLFKGFLQYGIEFDPSLYPVNLRKASCKNDVIRMLDSDYELVAKSLSKEQLRRINIERAS